MRTAAALLLLALCACAGSAPPPARSGEASSPAQTVVDVVRDRDRWIADFRFAADAPVWAFTRSPLADEGKQPWRPQHWVVETPGVRIERRGHYDVLVADGGDVPRRVRVRFTPFGQDVIASYNPALIFSDGSVALFSAQFASFPVRSTAEAERLPLDLNGTELAPDDVLLTFRDRSGPVLHAGRRVARATMIGGGTYVYFGRGKPIMTEAMATVIDPQLPGWLRVTLAQATPQIFARYTTELGPAPGDRPMVMVSWAGPTPRVVSMTGSTLPSLIVMNFKGEGLLEPHARRKAYGMWFIAHEAAHFWLGQAVRYEFSRDAWITEGGSELLAIRTVAAFEPSYEARAELQARLDECVELSRGRAVASAQERNEHRAYYACGAMFALVAEAAARRKGDGSFYSFVRQLIDANRGDKVVTKDEWLAALTQVSGDATLERDVRGMIETGIADPRPILASLFTRVGVPHAREADGRLRLT